MMLKVFDFLRSCLWYIVDFIYDLIDMLIAVIRKINAFDIINSLSENSIFQGLHRGIIAIAITLFALFIIWKFVNKILNPDDEITVKMIVSDAVKCGAMILLSTFLFSQVATFSIKLANYTGSVFESNGSSRMSGNILQLFIEYKDDYVNSSKFDEKETIPELVNSKKFENDELYLAKYVTKHRIIFADSKDYKYNINWIMAILCGGFFLYSLFFAGIMLGRRQIEFLFLFIISPIVFATSVCNKQRRGAVIEQLVSLALQSAVVMLIVSLTVMAMQQISKTTFFYAGFMDMVVKVILYLGCATFILTGSQTINRFIGANVSASSGREQLMSLMGFGKMAGVGTAVAGAGAIGGGLLATGAGMKAGKYAKNQAFSKVGLALGTMGTPSNSSDKQTKIQQVASSIGTKMYAHSQRSISKEQANNGKFKVSDALMNAGSSGIDTAIRKVMPRSSYNASYYRRRKNMM